MERFAHPCQEKEKAFKSGGRYNPAVGGKLSCPKYSLTGIKLENEGFMFN
jgi:hypothetical protein